MKLNCIRNFLVQISRIFILVLLLFCFNQCKKESCDDGILNQDEIDIDCGGKKCNECKITYPEIGLYGTNILNENTYEFNATKSFNTSYPYSIAANLPEGSSLKIKIDETSGTGAIWGLSVGTDIKWTVESFDFSTYSQYFNTSIVGEADYRISLKDSGFATIEFYENGAIVPTRVKNIVWH